MNGTSRIVVKRGRPPRRVPLVFWWAAGFSIAALFLVTPAVYGQTSSEAGAAQRHAQHLRHGINLSEWFAQVYDTKGYTKEHFEAWTTAEDIVLIKAMGFDHVRLSVNPQPMWKRGQADRIPADYLGYLDRAGQMIVDQGLAVIIGIHPGSGFKQKLVTDDGFVEQVADYWRGEGLACCSAKPGIVL